MLDWRKIAVTLASTASVGLFSYACYKKFMDSTVRPSVVVRSDGKREVSLTLEKAHLEWLQEMTQKYDLPTIGKALRIVILYAKQQHDQEGIFEKVRATLGKDENKWTEIYLLDKEHDNYLDEAVSSYKLADKDKAIRSILDYALSKNDADNIFEVKRCKHGSSCACAHV